MFRRSVITFMVICSAGLLAAQETRSTLTGFVADSTGARIPNAGLTITDTGVVTKSKSNGTGAYNVPFLQSHD